MVIIQNHVVMLFFFLDMYYRNTMDFWTLYHFFYLFFTLPFMYYCNFLNELLFYIFILVLFHLVIWQNVPVTAI